MVKIEEIHERNIGQSATVSVAHLENGASSPSKPGKVAAIHTELEEVAVSQSFGDKNSEKYIARISPTDDAGFGGDVIQPPTESHVADSNTTDTPGEEPLPGVVANSESPPQVKSDE